MIENEVKKISENIECIEEKTPLGTAGGVKNCVKDGYDAYLVVSGDGVFDFDLQSVIEKHFENNACVSIVCTRKQDPTQFGIIRCDILGRITELNEKPAWKNVTTDLVNTGIYVLSPKAVKMIPDNETYDFSKQLFKQLLKLDERLFAIITDGFWCDIGTLQEYKNCNRFAITKENGVDIFKDFRKNEKTGFEISPESYVYKNVLVGKNADIKNKSVVCKNVNIGENCEISASIVSEGAVIGKGSGVYDSVIGENVIVGENCIIPEGCVLGDNCRICDSAVLGKGTLVRNSCVVNGVDFCKTGGKSMKNIFVDDGLCVILLNNNAVDECMLLGMSIAKSFSKKDKRQAKICVASCEDSQVYKSAFVTGALMYNAEITEIEKCDINVLWFCSSFFACDVFVYFKMNEKDLLEVKILERNAKELCDENERKIIKNAEEIKSEFQNNVETQNNKNLIRTRINKIDVSDMYLSFLEEFFEDTGMDADIPKPKINILQITKQNSVSFDIFKRVLEKFGFEIYYGTENAVKIYFCSNIDECFVKYKNHVVDKNHIQAIVLDNVEVLDVCGIELGKNMPLSLRKMSEKIKNHGKKSRMINLFDRDSCVMLLSLLSVFSKSNNMVENIILQIPQFEICRDIMIDDVDKANTMQRLANLYKNTDGYEGDGINLCLAKGNVTIIPSRAKGFKIISEARDAETAKEIVVDIEKIIKQKEKN